MKKTYLETTAAHQLAKFEGTGSVERGTRAFAGATGRITRIAGKVDCFAGHRHRMGALLRRAAPLIPALAVASALTLAAPAAATVPAGNLLADPGAEQGGAATDAVQVVGPPSPVGQPGLTHPSWTGGSASLVADATGERRLGLASAPCGAACPACVCDITPDCV